MQMAHKVTNCFSGYEYGTEQINQSQNDLIRLFEWSKE